MVKDSAQSLLTIINDILDFSKVEAGRVELDNIDFNVLALLEDCADLLAPAARKKGLALLTWVDPRLPMTLRGDPVRVRQILLNLASNAVKFTRRGEVFLKAELDNLVTENGLGREPGTITVKFSVTDSGIGLSESARKRLFRPFVQADGSTTRKYGGTGLGLSICKLLAEMMSGTIDFVSEAGRGSSFWFVIPIGLAQDQTRLEQLLRPRTQLGSGTQLANIPSRLESVFSVLLLSPSLALQGIVDSYLSLYNIKVMAVPSLEEALEFMKNGVLASPSHELLEVPQLPEIRMIIYDIAIGQEVVDSPSSVEASDSRSGAGSSVYGSANNISGNFPVAPSLYELEQFQAFRQASLAAFGRSIPGLLVLGGSGLPGAETVAGASSYVGHLQKPFRLFEFLTEVEKAYSGTSSLEAVLMAVPSSPAVIDSSLSSSSSSSSSSSNQIQSNLAVDQRILIAEDNTVMQELALRQVQRLGLAADLVGNGSEALEAFRTGLYSLILMDCQMPEMDGYEATLLIRKEEEACGGHIPVIAMTASAMKGDRENCIAAGMDDYLSKPVGQEQLYRLLEKWLKPAAVDSTSAIKRGELISSPETSERPVQEVPINCEELAALYGLADLKRLISSFSAECEELMSCIRQAVASNNDLELIRLAHQLKGIGGCHDCWLAFSCSFGP
jgi:two-component system sensor histidine kinase/response regulator